MTCPFCRISSERERVITERKNVWVILSNPRLVKGHLLVVPKRHVEKPSELNEIERKKLFDVVLEFQQKILQQLASGCDVRQNCRPFLKEDQYKVNHVHFHLLPREFGDEMYQKALRFQYELFADLPLQESKELLTVFGGE